MADDEKARQRRRYERRKAENPTLCKICGKVVQPLYTLSGRMATRHYHEECIVDEAIKAILDGFTIKDSLALQRAKNRNYSKAEILAIMQEKGIEYNGKRHSN